MLAELKMQLNDSDNRLSFHQSSIMHGILMERIDTSYAEKLHSSSLNPFSQAVIQENGVRYWVIKTTTEEAYENIILTLCKPEFSSFYIKKKEAEIGIAGKSISTKPMEELYREFYSSSAPDRYTNIEFLVPASFKSDGQYCIFPTIRLIYQSLMNKFSTASSTIDMFDDKTLESIVDGSKIVNYKLRSINFPVEQTRIPGFMGEITVKSVKTETLARFMRLLAQFGEYSGIGVKTGMGMGAIRLFKKERTA